MSWLNLRRSRPCLSGTGSQSHSRPVTSRTSPAGCAATNATLPCTARHKIAPAAESTMPVVRRRAGDAGLLLLFPGRPGPFWLVPFWPELGWRELSAWRLLAARTAARDCASRGGAFHGETSRSGIFRDGSARDNGARGWAARAWAACGLGSGARLSAAMARRLARSAGEIEVDVTDACRTRLGRTGG